ncbi:MAG: hypothetical protein A2074_04115 [Candidatus Aquicultor primus]|uniref:Glycosyl transferase n=1 Tax=Candidatus Aquicultor primus TaxID=1797195 RepID=A0A1F2UY36_9ACTN|nr:MAG: hypothetical protein A2074_04115 [Candidatus Aquicultor primus]
MSDIAVFTIASKNYFAFAKTLLDSVRKVHPSGVDLYLFLADEAAGALPASGLPFDIVEAKDLPLKNLSRMAMQYDIMEFNTSIKPSCFAYLFAKKYKKVLYLDPDIQVYRPLDQLFSALETGSLLLTPHITEPLPESDNFIPPEQEYLRAGTYNLGFIGVSARDEGLRFTDWWGRKCEEQCFSESETGLFVDQKWVNLAPGLFSEVVISRDKGLNMAYWNLQERTLGPDLTVNGKTPLVFYHFSGINISDPSDISKYQTRYRLGDRPDLKDIFGAYCGQVTGNGHDKYRLLPYAYSNFSDGRRIGDFARRHYPAVSRRFPEPFRTGEGTYYEYLRRNNLLESPQASRPVAGSYTGQKKRFNWLLKMCCRLIGVDRYKNLMIYLRKISIIRNQDFWT